MKALNNYECVAQIEPFRYRAAHPHLGRPQHAGRSSAGLSVSPSSSSSPSAHISLAHTRQRHNAQPPEHDGARVARHDGSMRARRSHDTDAADYRKAFSSEPNGPQRQDNPRPPNPVVRPRGNKDRGHDEPNGYLAHTRPKSAIGNVPRARIGGYARPLCCPIEDVPKTNAYDCRETWARGPGWWSGRRRENIRAHGAAISLWARET